jgi:hypothetical protein
MGPGSGALLDPTRAALYIDVSKLEVEYGKFFYFPHF